MGLYYDVHHLTNIPSRTDLGELPNYRKQEGKTTRQVACYRLQGL